MAELLITALYKVKKHNPHCAYIAPLYRQSKSIAWDYLKSFTHAIPGVAINEAELKVSIPLPDNQGVARLQLFGADSPDSLRGQYFDLVILDEYAQMSHRLFPEIVRPALTDRHGSCIIIGTPKGMNTFYDMYKQASTNPDWSAIMYKASETGIVDAKELKAARKIMDEAQYEQEFECSWQAAIKGAYYGKLMAAAEADARITKVPHDPSLLVTTTWDLGISDKTVIWFIQKVNLETRAIRCLAFQGLGLPEIVKKIRDLPYSYDKHILPHDVKVRELGSGLSRVDILKNLGVKATVAPLLSVADGIAATRALIPKMWFDTDHCAEGIEALKQYRTEFDEKRNVFRDNPLHDAASDYADSLRYYAVMLINSHESNYNDWSTAVN